MRNPAKRMPFTAHPAAPPPNKDGQVCELASWAASPRPAPAKSSRDRTSSGVQFVAESLLCVPPRRGPEWRGVVAGQPNWPSPATG